MARVSYGTANARDLLAVGNDSVVIPYIKELLCESGSAELKRIFAELDPLAELSEKLLRAIDEEPAVTVREGGMIADGYSSEIDELRGIINNSKEYKLKIQERERRADGNQNAQDRLQPRVRLLHRGLKIIRFGGSLRLYP